MFVQSLSTFCQRSVQLAAKYEVCPDLVKVLSSPCPRSSSWTKIGHKNPIFVQSMSKGKMLQTTFSQYWTKSGQMLDMDNLWTKLGFLVLRLGDSKKLRQSLDKHWKMTNSRQSSDFISCGRWPTNGHSLTIGQTLDKH